MVKKKKSKKRIVRKKKQEINFAYLRWLSIGFGIASVGIAIAGILFILTAGKR